MRAARIATARLWLSDDRRGDRRGLCRCWRPNITIIPLALGILGYGYGALLGVFLLGVLTERRGHDVANVFGMLLGIAAVLILAKIQIPYYSSLDPVTGPGNHAQDRVWWVHAVSGGRRFPGRILFSLAAL